MNKSLIEYGTSIFEYFNPKAIKGEKYGWALRNIGLFLTAGFILPYFYRVIYFDFEPGQSSAYSEIPHILRIILFYLPIIYGFGLLVYSNYTDAGKLDIPLLIIAVIPFILLPASPCSADLEFFRITGINTLGTIWLFLLSHILFMAGLLLKKEEIKYTAPRILIITSLIIFILNLLVPARMYIWDFMISYSRDKMLIAMPFSLINETKYFTGLVLLIYLLLMLYIYARELYLKKKQDVNDSQTKGWYALSWVILLAGMFLAGNGDIFIAGVSEPVYPWRAHLRECLYYFKSVLYLFPLFAFLIIQIFRLIKE